MMSCMSKQKTGLRGIEAHRWLVEHKHPSILFECAGADDELLDSYGIRPERVFHIRSGRYGRATAWTDGSAQ
jgi:hypothetical protein